MRGADERSERDVVAQMLADPEGGGVIRSGGRLGWLLGQDRAGKRNQQGHQLREFE